MNIHCQILIYSFVVFHNKNNPKNGFFGSQITIVYSQFDTNRIKF